MLKRLHINLGELTARAHERGFDELSEVETAVLYPNGTIYMKGSGPSDSDPVSERSSTSSRQSAASWPRCGVERACPPDLKVGPTVVGSARRRSVRRPDLQVGREPEPSWKLEAPSVTTSR